MADNGLPGAGQVFNADAMFATDGVTFKGLKSPGVALVETPDGEIAEFDANGFLRENNMQGAEIQFNTPETALQDQTPVTAMDRLRLAFGNKKGGVQYLQNNYQNATVSEDGQLLVQKDGVWSTIDPEGFTNGDGWSFAEVIGDMADISRDVVMGAAQIAGGVAAGAGTAGAGAAAGAVGASALASGASQALGRVLGTYDATPEEVVKEVALDTAMAALGEGVALGAKHLVMPAVKGFWKKGAALADDAKAVVSDFVSSTTGISQEASMTAFSQADEMGRVLERISNAARTPKELLSDNVAAGVRPSSFPAVLNAADDMMARSLKEVVEEAPNWLSRDWRRGMSKAVNSVDANTAMPSQAIDAVKTAMAEFSEMGLFNMQSRGSQPAFARPKTIAELMRTGVSQQEASAILKATKEVVQHYNSLVGEAAGLKGPKAMTRLAEMMRMSDEMVGTLTKGQQTMVGDAYVGIGTKLANSVVGAMPESMRSGIAATRQQYAQNIGFIQQIKNMREGPGKNWGTAAMNMAKMYRNKARGDTNATMMFQALGRLDPKAQTAINQLQVINAAAEWRTVGSENLWAPLQGSQRTVRRLGFAGAQAVRGMGRMVANAVRPVTQPMSQVAKTVRGMASPIYNDSQALAAALTTAMQGMRQ